MSHSESPGVPASVTSSWRRQRIRGDHCVLTEGLMWAWARLQCLHSVSNNLEHRVALSLAQVCGNSVYGSREKLVAPERVLGWFWGLCWHGSLSQLENLPSVGLVFWPSCGLVGSVCNLWCRNSIPHICHTVLQLPLLHPVQLLGGLQLLLSFTSFSVLCYLSQVWYENKDLFK